MVDSLNVLYNVIKNDIININNIITKFDKEYSRIIKFLNNILCYIFNLFYKC